jgi:hypothetical protein
MRRKVRLKIFLEKTFGGKHLYREPKLGLMGQSAHMRTKVQVPVVRLSERCLSVSSFPLHWAGVLASIALCICARRCARGTPIEPMLVFSEVPHHWFRTPARLSGPPRYPLFKLVWFCWIIEGRPKFCSRTCILHTKRKIVHSVSNRIIVLFKHICDYKNVLESHNSMYFL